MYSSKRKIHLDNLYTV